MSVFQDDHAEHMNDPEYAYQYGRFEREMEIIQLLEEYDCDGVIIGNTKGLLARIQGQIK